MSDQDPWSRLPLGLQILLLIIGLLIIGALLGYSGGGTG